MADEDDEVVWSHVVSDVEPLKDRNLPSDHNLKVKTQPKKAKSSSKEFKILKKPDISTDLKTAPSKDIDKRTDERLRRGQMKIDLTLDLHGMNREQAQRALSHSLQDAYQAGKRTILIITGKGRGKAGSADWIAPKPGVLKQNLPSWLSEPPLATIVLKAYPAKPSDGGNGAFYVYLRRKRESNPEFH